MTFLLLFGIHQSFYSVELEFLIGWTRFTVVRMRRLVKLGRIHRVKLDSRARTRSAITVVDGFDPSEQRCVALNKVHLFPLARTLQYLQCT